MYFSSFSKKFHNLFLFFKIILEKILLAGTSRTQSYDKEDELDINCIMEIVNLKIQFTPQIIKFIQTIIFQTKEEPSKKIERTVGKK